MNHYLGMRGPKGEAVVKLNGQPFDPARSQRVRNHSPSGLRVGLWGFEVGPTGLGHPPRGGGRGKRPESVPGLQVGRHRQTEWRMDDGQLLHPERIEVAPALTLSR